MTTDMQVAWPLAVIIKGNPKYLDDPKMKPLANIFYAEISIILKVRKYRVEFDAGEAYTTPNETARVWIAHSRGISRLKFAPAHIKTIALETMDHHKQYKNIDQQGMDPDHYKLSPKDLDRLHSL